MLGTDRRFLIPVFASMALAGCNNLQTANQMQVQRMADTRGCTAPTYAHMADNALLQDMSIADFHFVAHSTELSGTGVVRLDRMAKLLDTYGGTVRYETYITDDDFIQQRLDHAKEYLALVGCNMDRVTLEAKISGGRLHRADEAVAAYDAGTNPTANSQGNAALSMPPGMGTPPPGTP